MIEQVLIISFCVIGVWITMQPGMIFEKVGGFIELHVADWLAMPVATCPICMSVWWGSVVSILAFDSWNFFVILAAMGLNTIIVKFMPDE